jgi:hypothetical protein
MMFGQPLLECPRAKIRTGSAADQKHRAVTVYPYAFFCASGCRVLSEFVCQMVAAEQRGRYLPVRGGRLGEQPLHVLGMELAKAA